MLGPLVWHPDRKGNAAVAVMKTRRLMAGFCLRNLEAELGRLMTSSREGNHLSN